MNTKHFAALLCAALVFSPCASLGEARTPAEALELQQEEPVIMRTAKEANLRSKPAKNAARINTLVRGKKVRVLEETNEGDERWAHVRVVDNGQEGYVLLSLLEALPEPTPSPSPTPVPTPTPMPTPDGPIVTPFETPLLARTTMLANLRTEPDGKRIDALKKNVFLDVLGKAEGEEGKIWYQVREKNGREGFVLAELLDEIQPAVLTEVSESEVRALFPVLSCDPIEDAYNADLPAYSDDVLAKYTTLNEGTRSMAVLRLKRQLYAKGYYKKPNENQNYTESTADVIRKFQKDVGLPVNGVADPVTQAALFDEAVPAREGSPQEPKYLDNERQPLVISKTDVTRRNYYGSVQVSVRNNSGKKLTAFGLRVIPYNADGNPADMAKTFEEEIKRVYSVHSIAIADGNSYSDFITNHKLDEGIWPHHFLVSKEIYFPGAQLAISWYRSGGKNIYVDDDQLVFVEAGKGAGQALIRTLPITLTDSEVKNAGWEMGISTHYVLPVYQDHYALPQGAWVKKVTDFSPAYDAGLMKGDVIVGIGDITILGDATLRKARGSVQPGESAELYFWRDGVYYKTDIIRPKE